jgi:methylenetetrahydrofolate reductase (NADPH)
MAYSLELFPPRTAEGATKLADTIQQLAALKPAFFSVTYGAGGSTQAGTYDTLRQVIEQTDIEAAPHLTCVGSSRAALRDLLQQYQAAGVKRIVALRGDLPATAMSSEAPGELHYANELVAFIKESFGDAFHLEVAAYPEMHPQAASPEADLAAFVQKVQAGADGAVTQYFYNADSYFDFCDRATAKGVSIPIVAGVMPIVNVQQVLRFSAACGAEVPRWLRLQLEQHQDDKTAVLEIGHQAVLKMSETLIAQGAPGIHFYTLNQAAPTLRLWRDLGL